MMKYLALFLTLFLISGCASDPIEQPVVVEIPAQLLEQVDTPVLAIETAGDVALLLVALVAALREANGQLAMIGELVERWKVALAS